VIKTLYKPLGLVASVLGGVLAGAAFKQVWKLIGHEGEPPEAKQPDRSWGEVLSAAALQGAIFGLVKAAIDRAGASGVAKATGTWPA